MAATATATKCLHKGCGKMFTEGDESETCVYHPGPPIFHEGQKGWKCCKPRVLTFDEFLSIPPCTTGRHSAVDENAVEAAAEKARQEAAASSILAESQRKRVPISDVFSSAIPSSASTSNKNGSGDVGAGAAVVGAAAPKQAEDDPETDTDDENLLVQPGQTCRRRGCGKSYSGDQPAKKRDLKISADDGAQGQSESGCRYHPGVPIFHEGSKGWSCCKRRVLEFDQFVKIEGCATKERHMFVGSGKTKAEKRREKKNKEAGAGGDAAAAAASEEDDAEDLIETVRHDMYQSATTLTVSFYIKNVIPEESTILFHKPTSTSSSPGAPSSKSEAPDSSGTLYLDLRTAAAGSLPPRHARSTISLFAPIVPSKCSYEIRKTKLELVLCKDVSVTGEAALGWPGLKADSASTGEILQVGSAGKA